MQHQIIVVSRTINNTAKQILFYLGGNTGMHKKYSPVAWSHAVTSKTEAVHFQC